MGGQKSSIPYYFLDDVVNDIRK
eukprot:SAG22_NODE_2573_length_2425_cov_16.697334_1_plen_22_part_10